MYLNVASKPIWEMVIGWERRISTLYLCIILLVKKEFKGSFIEYIWKWVFVCVYGITYGCMQRYDTDTCALTCIPTHNIHSYTYVRMNTRKHLLPIIIYITYTEIVSLDLNFEDILSSIKSTRDIISIPFEVAKI